MSSSLVLSEAQSALRTARIDIELSQDQFHRIQLYLTRRQEWSAAHNLAGPKSLQDPIIDLIDACALNGILSASPLVDVGTGSGTPGILVSCLNPKLSIILVEPLAKRTAFLRSVTHELGLTNVETKRTKWPCEHDFEGVQLVSRAVVSPTKWPSLASSGGDSVRTIHRMLAQKRPNMTVEGFDLSAAVHYVMPDGSERMIERWDRS